MSNTELDDKQVGAYFRNLVNKLFKILPMRENNDETRSAYMESLLTELVGCQRLAVVVGFDPDLTTIMFLLQAMIDNPDYSVKRIKRDVFRSISLCNKIIERHFSEV